MNAITQIETGTAIYPALGLVVLEEITGNEITFFLQSEKNSDIYIAATVLGKKTYSYTTFSDGNPENDQDVDFDSLEVDEESVATVYDSDNVSASSEITLTYKQVKQLNDQIQDYLEDEFRESIDQDARDRADYYYEMEG